MVCPDDRPGYHCVESTSKDNFTNATAAAAEADQVVLFLGTDSGVETEGACVASVCVCACVRALF